MSLFELWSAEHKRLGEFKDAERDILAAVNQVRSDTRDVLKSLD